MARRRWPALGVLRVLACAATMAAAAAVVAGADAAAAASPPPPPPVGAPSETTPPEGGLPAHLRLPALGVHQRDEFAAALRLLVKLGERAPHAYTGEAAIAPDGSAEQAAAPPAGRSAWQRVGVPSSAAGLQTR